MMDQVPDVNAVAYALAIALDQVWDEVSAHERALAAGKMTRNDRKLHMLRLKLSRQRMATLFWLNYRASHAAICQASKD